MTLNALQYGSPNQTSVVFLHGAGVTSWMWLDFMHALPDLHTLAPDLPGLGRNAHLAPFEIESAARHLASFIGERTPDGRAHVVGHSLGGAVAAHLAAHFPSVTRSVTLIGVTARPIRFERALVTAMMGLGPVMRVPWVARAQARALGVAPSHQAHFVADQRAMTSDVLRAVMAQGAQFRVPVGLRHAGVPLLALVGSREGALNLHSALDLVEGVPGARALTVPDGSHAWMARQPRLLLDALTAFWAGAPLPPELVALPRAEGGPTASRI